MGQSWLESLEPGFQWSYVSLAWFPDSLVVQAALIDTEIGTQAAEDGQRLWELGDTFEMFFGETGSPSYVELHVAPNGNRLSLRLAGPEDVVSARRTGDIGPILVDPPTFQANVVVNRELALWEVSAALPAVLISQKGAISPGDLWDACFSRYDYSGPDSKPVLSSSATLRALDFHRRAEWDRLQFVD